MLSKDVIAEAKSRLCFPAPSLAFKNPWTSPGRGGAVLPARAP